MDRPRIAIIGSPWLRDASGVRITNDVAVSHETLAKLACEALGESLAKSECRLLVYSAVWKALTYGAVAGFIFSLLYLFPQDLTGKGP